jgi:two-component system OmpR family sensor kinase
MSEPVWYRSLYWRIAFGFVALLAALLVIQAAVFVWLTVVVGRSTLGPAQLASEVAADIGHEIAHTPHLALDEFVKRRYGHIYQPFLVVMNDGRSASNRPDGLPPDFGMFVRARSRRSAADEPAERNRPEGPSRGPGRGGRRPVEIAPITIAGTEGEAGFVAVPGNPPPVSVVMQQLGPTLAWVAVGLLIGGSALMALLIFRPARKRLRTLEEAASALGEGRTDVRAVETGGDEVTTLARTFNRMADDLGARAQALVAADRARRQLLADVSHELMTPLAAIRGYTETLAMPELSLDAPTRQRYLAIIGDETQKLEAMIGDLLDLARLEGGGGTLVVEDVRVSDLFGRITDRHGPTIRDRGIDVVSSVEPRDLAVQGDPHRLEEALQNLAANALRHTPAGGRIELRARLDTDRVTLVVRDTGPGIPPEHLPRVFDRFYKVDASRTTTSTPSGSGLGLSIVRAIVERHGGTVLARNASGGGAEFEVTLPLIIGRDAAGVS